VDEFELIRRFFVRPDEAEGVVVGVGDDGAVLSPAPGRALVAVVDTLIEGVHWPAALPPADIGFRAVAVNVSDVAAMGGRPRWMTLALTLAEADESWLTQFAAGLFAAADAYGASLVGGDVTRGAQTVISVQIIGDVDPGCILKRSGAAAGEGIYVTGTPGDAAAGLSLLQDAGKHAADKEVRRYLIKRFSRPAIPLAFAGAIAPIAGAAIDLSDGLFADAKKLLDASGKGGRIEVESLPLSPALERAFPEEERLRFALAGGDDYELCFTAGAANEARVFAAAKRCGVRVARIGEVREGSGLVCTRAGREFRFADCGYRHFR
jgi:thiamine-monophosphate kinase